MRRDCAKEEFTAEDAEHAERKTGKVRVIVVTVLAPNGLRLIPKKKKMPFSAFSEPAPDPDPGISAVKINNSNYRRDSHTLPRISRPVFGFHNISVGVPWSDAGRIRFLRSGIPGQGT